MVSFVIHGPFPLKYEKRKGGRTLVFDEFWNKGKASEFALRRGCYVFAISNKGKTPLYVGKATKTFKQETFNAANKSKYHNGFSDYAKGLPVIYFAVAPKNNGPVNNKAITELEDFLIQAGVAKNPNLQNVKGKQRPKWSIKGVLRSGRGKPSKAGSQFSKLFDIK